MNLEERPFAVCSPQLDGRAPQRAVHPCQLAVRAQRGRAHTERAQVIRCSHKKARQARVIVMLISGEAKIPNVGVSGAHVQKEIPGCCCRGCCSCSPLGPLQESSDLDQRGCHEPAECSSDSPLHRERDLISQCFNVKLCLVRFLQTSYWLSCNEPGIRICSPHRMFR